MNTILLQFDHIIALYMVTFGKMFVDHAESEKFANYLKLALSNKIRISTNSNIKEFEKNNATMYSNLFTIGGGYVSLHSMHTFEDLNVVLSTLDPKFVKSFLKNKNEIQADFEEYKTTRKHISL